ncbi:TPA: LPXTG cell wall anchor domain-containing protein, partial [Streptococcus suis]
SVPGDTGGSSDTVVPGDTGGSSDTPSSGDAGGNNDTPISEIETAKTEPAYHEIPNFDIEAWIEGLIKENEQSPDLVTAKGESLVHVLPAFDGGLVPNEAPIAEELPIIDPTSLMKQVPLASQTSQTTSKAEKALPATGDTHSDLALVGLTVLGLLGTAVRKRKG